MNVSGFAELILLMISYHPGGWGKPPVDEHGNPIYGDVFGILLHTHTFSTNAHMGKHWGALDSDDGSDEEDDESEHDDDDQEVSEWHLM